MRQLRGEGCGSCAVLTGVSNGRNGMTTGTTSAMITGMVMFTTMITRTLPTTMTIITPTTPTLVNGVSTTPLR